MENKKIPLASIIEVIEFIESKNFRPGSDEETVLDYLRELRDGDGEKNV